MAGDTHLSKGTPPAAAPDEQVGARQVRALERIARVLGWTAGIAATAIVFWLLGDVLLLVFAAVLLATGLHGAAAFLSRQLRLPRGVALAIVLLGLTALFGLAAWWTGPRLVNEAGQLKDQLTRQWTTLSSWLSTTNWGSALLRELPTSLGGSAQMSGVAPRVAGTIAGALWSAVGLFGTGVLLLASGIYFAATPKPYFEGPLRLLPHRIRGRTREILVEVAETLGYWLAGQLLDMLVVGVVTGAGLALLGVPLAFILGVTAGLLNFVPYIGAIGGAIPAVLIALAQGPNQAIFVALLFVVVQGLEGNVLSPMIQRRAVDLPPAATILAQTALGALFGMAGIILATPLAAAILTVLRQLTADSPDND